MDAVIDEQGTVNFIVMSLVLNIIFHLEKRKASISLSLTASISLRIFHCSYVTPRDSAVWIVLFSWLVHTFSSTISCSSMNFFSA